MVFAHLLVKELNTKLKEEFNEDPDDEDLDKLISGPSLEPSVCVYTAVAEPTTRRQALASPNAEQWQKAMQEEVDTITRKGTFLLATLPPGRIALPVKWVFKTKLDAQGAISRFKAKGFKEIPGQDYDETFSPVAQYRSLRILLAIAAQYDLDLHQMDVVSAFLNGKIEHEIYIQQPEGFDDKSGRICRLHKAIYGLKQASRCWNAEVHSTDQPWLRVVSWRYLSLRPEPGSGDRHPAALCRRHGAHYHKQTVERVGCPSSACGV